MQFVYMNIRIHAYTCTKVTHLGECISSPVSLLHQTPAPCLYRKVFHGAAKTAKVLGARSKPPPVVSKHER